MRRLCAVVIAAASMFVGPLYASAATVQPKADGPAPCTAGGPPFGWHGLCATYNGNNTYFGLHGLGFPSPLGWGLCAVRPAQGGGYPAPGYQYTLGSAPSGANLSRTNALGWAFSDAQRQGLWTKGQPGSFSADQLGVAAKLLYDNVVWGTPLPTLDAATQRALTTLRTLMNAATGITNPPTLALSLQGGGTTLQTTGTLIATVTAPGVTSGLAGVPITLSLSGATFDQNHLSTLTLTTNSSGRVSASFTTTSSTPSTVTATANAVLALPGLLFYGPTIIVPTAQIIASPRAPVAASQRLTLTASGAPTGTVQVQKEGDDTAYFPVSDAVFQVLDGANTVVATLVTDAHGVSPVSEPLPVGAYTLHELTPPAGYEPAADQTFAIVANTLTTVSVTPAQGDAIRRASVTIEKLDALSHTDLAGAVYSVTFDPTNTHQDNGTTFTCTTDTTGKCGWTDLLPGNYLLREVTPPANYEPNHLAQWIYVGPSEVHTFTYHDRPQFVTLSARKFNAETDQAIPHATYDLYVEDPAPPGPLPTPPPDTEHFSGLTFMERGTTDEAGHLTFTVRAGYAWCLLEVFVPEPYVIDPALHCTGVLTAHVRHAPLALPEHPSLVHLDVRKFNATDPSQGVPGAYYALFVRDPFPSGYAPSPAPTNIDVPHGTTLWAIDATNAHGILRFSVPSGSSWCVRELTAPAGYHLDPALHCTGILNVDTPAAQLSVAVPELAFTGLPLTPLILAVIFLFFGAALVLLAGRSRRTAPR